MRYQFYVPTRLLSGPGQLNALHEQALPGKKALIVISNGKSTLQNGSLARVEGELEKAGVEYALFNRVQANPLDTTVMEGAAAARQNGCDFLVALGGGSVLDCAKAIAALATNPGDVWDYISGGTGKGQPIVQTPLPLVAITTTAGTGSEVDEWGVISNTKTNEKIGFGGDDRLFPVLSIVDPELMVTVPPSFTAYQGFDALLQATEVYIGKFSNLLSDMYCKDTIENVGRYLARAVADGGDLEARAHVAHANTMSGYAMVTGCTGSEHSIEHAMSAYHPALPHGAGLIMISLAWYSHFIERGAVPERFIQMARLLGKQDASRPEDFVTALASLQASCGVDSLKMSDYGITPQEFPAIARNARETMGGLFAADPVELSEDDVVAILQKSYS